MRHPWLAYLIVGLLSVGAGIAIAGLPDNVSGDATIIPPTTVASDLTGPETTVPVTTVPPTTQPRATALDTTVPDTTEPNTTDLDATESDTTESDAAPLPGRSELRVIAANGANIAGAALRMTERLQAIGYVDVLPLNGSDIVDFTTVYFVEGFEDAALRLAEDLELLDVFVAPIENSPSVEMLPLDSELLVYIGVDRA
jgi:hypothetical protein